MSLSWRAPRRVLTLAALTACGRASSGGASVPTTASPVPISSDAPNAARSAEPPPGPAKPSAATEPSRKQLPTPGAKSSRGRTASAEAEKLCDCHKKITGAKDCADLLGEANADCSRTYPNDCTMLLGCARGEPGAAPSCLAGFVNGAPTGQCKKLCKVAADCAATETCEDDGLGRNVCMDR